MSSQVGDEAHSTEHGTPQEGLECLACFEDIDGSNYVEYTAVQDGMFNMCVCVCASR